MNAFTVINNECYPALACQPVGAEKYGLAFLFGKKKLSYDIPEQKSSIIKISQIMEHLKSGVSIIHTFL